MIYFFLKNLLRLTLHSYFKVWHISGKENIPKEGPIIFVANHPSSFMDPMVIGTLIKSNIHFLAAAEFFGTGVQSWFMQRMLHMIPVYRPHTQPGKSQKNVDIFDRCFSHLGNKGCILIFPEGISVTLKKLQPVKTGTARMAIGTQEKFDIPVKVVPIGLNYSNPHKFQSELFVSIGEPISTDDEMFKNFTDSFEKAKAMTVQIEKRLKENIIHVEDEQFLALFEKVRLITGHDLHQQVGGKPDLKTKFELNQEIQDGLAFYTQQHPEMLMSLHKRLDDYIKRASFYGINDVTLSGGNSKVHWKEYLKIIFGTPIFVTGWLTNAGPYFLSVWIFKKLKVRASFAGAIGMMIGLVLYLIWYISIGVILSQFTHQWWVGFAAFLLMYGTGRFTLGYYSIINNLRQNGSLKKILRRDRMVYKSLKVERKEIMNSILLYARMAK